MAAIANLFIDQGSTFSTSVNVKNDDETAFDLTNHTAAAQIRKSYSSSTATDFTTATVSATDGTCTITLTDTVTSALDEGRYVWDLITTDGSGIKTRRIEGRATVTPSVTR